METQYENAILITIDSLRWDAIFTKEGQICEDLTFFRSISKNSIIFRNAFSNGAGTPASFPSIMTSTYPLMYGGYKGIGKRRKPIAELLYENGFSTIGIPNNAYLSRYFGYDRGFDVFYDSIEDSISIKQKVLYLLSKKISKSKFLSNLTQAINMFFNINPSYLEAWQITAYIKSLLKKDLIKSPFFMWIHFVDVHIPYYSPKIRYNDISTLTIRKLHFKIFMYEHFKRILSQNDLDKIKYLYNLKVQYLDNELKKLFDMLSEFGILDNTLIILTSDHGEEFLEHGDLIHPPKLYDELIHIPLIVYSRDIDGPIWVDSLAEHLDIAPTIAKALGVKVPKQYLGKSLFDIVYGRVKKDYIISEVAQPKYKLEIDYNKRKTSIRTKSIKFIWDKENSRYELYNLREDPYEKQNLLLKLPDEKKREIIQIFMKIIKTHLNKEKISNVSKYLRNIKEL